METTIKPTNVMANVIPLADIQNVTRESMLHQAEVRDIVMVILERHQK